MVSFPHSVPTSPGEGTVGREVQGSQGAEKPGEGAVCPPHGLHGAPDKVIPGSFPDIAILFTNVAQQSQTGPNPVTIEEARAAPDGPKWNDAIKVELDVMTNKGVWHLA